MLRARSTEAFVAVSFAASRLPLTVNQLFKMGLYGSGSGGFALNLVVFQVRCLAEEFRAPGGSKGRRAGSVFPRFCVSENHLFRVEAWFRIRGESRFLETGLAEVQPRITAYVLCPMYQPRTWSPEP